jgi:dihydroflavonol-4-reductase
MKLFLTGGTGFIGQRLTQVLLTRGWAVTALVRRPESAEALKLAALGATLVRGDVTDRESMRSGMIGADVVIHNAGVYKYGLTPAEKAQMQAINVDGTENTLGLAVELGIGRLVHVSTIQAYGPTGDQVADESFQRQQPPETVYERTKTDAHAIAVRLQKQGAPVIIVCPGGVVGPGDHSTLGHYARLYVRHLLLPLFVEAEAIFPTVHVDDLAEAMAAAVEKGRPGESYLLNGGNITYREMMATWARTPGGLKRPLWLTRTLAAPLCALSEPIKRLFGLPVVLSREAALAGARKWAFSGAKAERELGAHFRSAEQAWLDTLAAERALLRK